jgi:hypothetical protein
MDTVDVGGASNAGRPPLPKAVVADEYGAVPEESTERSSVSTPLGKASVAYEDAHPSKSEEFEKDLDGGLILTRANERKEAAVPLGDVRDGYVTGPRQEGGSTSVSEIEKTTQELDAELASLNEGEENATPAHSGTGEPLIEVLFHLEVGVLASYHTHVVEQGQWLVFVDDTTQAAKQKFIPNPTAEPIKVTITGADGVSQERQITPLGINFRLSHYEFFVTMNNQEQETE